MTRDEIDQRLAELQAEAQVILAKSRFQAFQPMPYQRAWFECDKKIVVVLGGNRIGKTEFGAVMTIMACTGVKPVAIGGQPVAAYPAGHLDGFRFAALGETMSTSVRDTILPKLRFYITPEMLLPPPHHIKKNNATGLEQIFRFRSGAELVIGSYDQDVSMWEGPRWNQVWFDEPPPQPHFKAFLRGTTDMGGRMLITCTPLKEPWMKDTLTDSVLDDKHPMHGSVDYFEVGMEENCREHSGGHIPHAEIEILAAALTPQERAARMYGKFMSMQGVEFKEYDPSIHVVPDLY